MTNIRCINEILQFDLLIIIVEYCKGWMVYGLGVFHRRESRSDFSCSLLLSSVDLQCSVRLSQHMGISAVWELVPHIKTALYCPSEDTKPHHVCHITVCLHWYDEAYLYCYFISFKTSTVIKITFALSCDLNIQMIFICF